MNERDHVLNALGLSIGIAAILHGNAPAPINFLAIGVPVILGALFPDIDTSFGTHRKTFHNVATLGAFLVFPVVFHNLHFVWIGVLTHYILDLLGNVRGMAIFYPIPTEYDIPVGVTVSSPWAGVVTVAVTAFELALAWVVVRTELHGVLLEVVTGL